MSVMTRGPRSILAMTVSLAMCGSGYLAFIISIHTPGPWLTAIQWLGLPVFSMFAASATVHSEPFYLMTVALGGAIWFMVVFFLLPHRRVAAGSRSR